MTHQLHDFYALELIPLQTIDGELAAVIIQHCEEYEDGTACPEFRTVAYGSLQDMQAKLIDMETKRDAEEEGETS